VAAKPRRSRRKTAAVPAAEEAATETVSTVDMVAAAQEAEAITETAIAPQVDAALGEDTPAAEPAEPEAEAEARPVRANRASNITSSDPVVKSSEPTAEASTDDEPGKPKKAGWWQRRGFF
jgi:ribonuclease E